MKVWWKILLDKLHQQKTIELDCRPHIINFKTNAQNFKIYYSVKNTVNGNFPHFGITAREGIHLLYRYQNTKNWFNVDAFSSRNSPISVNMKHIIKEDEEYEILIYEPLLSEVSELKIEIPKNYEIEYLENKKDKTILIAGGAHSFGVGCTACGVMFPNILGRKLDYNIQNVSFNRRNFLEFTYKYFKNNKHPKVELGILELDHILQYDEIFDEYAEKVIQQMKSNTDKLICWYTIPKTADKKHTKLKKLIENYSKDKKIKIVDLSFIYDEEYSEMCTHSKNYINDTGNIMIYKKLEEIITNSEFTKGRRKIWNI